MGEDGADGGSEDMRPRGQQGLVPCCSRGYQPHSRPHQMRPLGGCVGMKRGGVWGVASGAMQQPRWERGRMSLFIRIYYYECIKEHLIFFFTYYGHTYHEKHYFHLSVTSTNKDR